MALSLSLYQDLEDSIMEVLKIDDESKCPNAW